MSFTDKRNAIIGVTRADIDRFMLQKYVHLHIHFDRVFNTYEKIKIWASTEKVP